MRHIKCSVFYWGSSPQNHTASFSGQRTNCWQLFFLRQWALGGWVPDGGEGYMRTGRQSEPKITSKFLLVRPTVSTQWLAGTDMGYQNCVFVCVCVLSRREHMWRAACMGVIELVISRWIWIRLALDITWATLGCLINCYYLWAGWPVSRQKGRIIAQQHDNTTIIYMQLLRAVHVCVCNHSQVSGCE